MGQKILITPRSLTGGHPALAPLSAAGFELTYAAAGRQPTEAELLAAVPECVGWLAGVEPISARVLEAAGALRVISRNGTGVNNIDLAAARARRIEVCRAEGANARGVAELAFGLILALVRAIPQSDAALKQGGWLRRQGSELEGLTLGLIGLGRIGRLVARFAWAFGMNVVAYDVFRPEGFTPEGPFAWAALDDLFAQADVISLHCPPPADGRAIVDRAAFARMKPGAMLVNTARAELIDEAAAGEALAAGRLGGLALDVFREEPPVDRSLLAYERVIATPHAGGFTAQSVARAATVAVENLLKVLQAGDERNPEGTGANRGAGVV